MGKGINSKRLSQYRYWCKCGAGPFNRHGLKLHKSKVHGIHEQRSNRR